MDTIGLASALVISDTDTKSWDRFLIFEMIRAEQDELAKK